MKNKTQFKDLSFWLKCAAIMGWVYLALFSFGFLMGFLWAIVEYL